MKNRFEQPFFKGLRNRLRTHQTSKELTVSPINKDLTVTSIYKTDDTPQSPTLIITHEITTPFPKVKTDGRGGFVIRPKNRFRKHSGEINVFASNGADVYVSCKVKTHEGTAKDRANLSVRRILNGWSTSQSNLHVRTDAQSLVVNNAKGRVEGHLTHGQASDSAILEAGAADTITIIGDVSQNDPTTVIIKKGGLDELTFCSNGHADVMGTVGAVKGGGTNNYLKTAGIKVNEYKGVLEVEYR